MCLLDSLPQLLHQPTTPHPDPPPPHTHRSVNDQTGLAADYTDHTGAGIKDLAGHSNFQWDAWRVVANVANDWAWFRRDAWQQRAADTLQAFLYSKGLHNYPSTFTLVRAGSVGWGRCCCCWVHAHTAAQRHYNTTTHPHLSIHPPTNPEHSHTTHHRTAPVS